MTAAWYVLRSKPNKEEFFRDQLLANHLEVFYPSIRVKVVNPRARKIKPYFPGYLFIHIDLQENKSFFLNRIPGSSGLVSFDDQPAAVPEALINAIRQRVEQINVTGLHPLAGLQPGQPVIIQDGPFAGHEAIFDARISGNERVRGLLRLLQGRQLPAELDGGAIRKKSE